LSYPRNRRRHGRELVEVLLRDGVEAQAFTQALQAPERRYGAWHRKPAVEAFGGFADFHGGVSVFPNRNSIVMAQATIGLRSQISRLGTLNMKH